MSNISEFRTLDIDWNMTPEDAVTLYLEWGNNSWHAEFPPVRSREDYSNYFVVYAWDDNPRAILIRRNSEEARELASLDLPHDMAERFMDSVANMHGVYPPNEEVRAWLERMMNN